MVWFTSPFRKDNAASTIKMNIKLEPNLSDDQLIKLYLHYKAEKEALDDELERHPLRDEIKAYAESIKKDVLALQLKLVSGRGVHL